MMFFDILICAAAVFVLCAAITSVKVLCLRGLRKLNTPKAAAAPQRVND